MTLEIHVVTTEADLQRCFALRKEIFVDEQQVPIEEEMDAYDAAATHFIGMDGGAIICCGRAVALDEICKVGRIAVRKDRRRDGIGNLLMAHIENWARGQFKKIKLSAQKYVEAFYGKRGYQTTSGIFQDAGIDHVWMELELKSPSPATRCPRCGHEISWLGAAQRRLTCPHCGANVERGAARV